MITNEQLAVMESDAQACVRMGAKPDRAREVLELIADYRVTVAAEERLRQMLARYTERCDQCVARRGAWQDENATRCPNHAHPYISCDGVLVAHPDVVCFVPSVLREVYGGESCHGLLDAHRRLLPVCETCLSYVAQSIAQEG